MAAELKKMEVVMTYPATIQRSVLFLSKKSFVNNRLWYNTQGNPRPQ